MAVYRECLGDSPLDTSAEEDVGVYIGRPGKICMLTSQENKHLLADLRVLYLSLLALFVSGTQGHVSPKLRTELQLYFLYRFGKGWSKKYPFRRLQSFR